MKDSDQFKQELSALKVNNENRSGKYFPGRYEDENKPNYFHSPEKKFNHSTNQEVFDFDPNTLSQEGWERLGISEKTITTIQHYLSKGGKFRKPEDLQKVWGIREDQVKRLIPYVVIKQTSPEWRPVTNNYPPSSLDQKKSIKLIDINGADSSEWISLPGIGSKLSNRIISFREKLGGFYNIDQVSEIFGLPDSVFQKIRPRLVLPNLNVRLINLNTASLDELKQHPYIRYHLANLIVQYRTQHGNFSDISELKKIMTVSNELYDKLSAYLSIK